MNYTYELWDGESDIAGITPNSWFTSWRFEVDKVILMYCDGKFITTIAHDPFQQGAIKITEDTADEIAQQWIERETRTIAENEINQQRQIDNDNAQILGLRLAAVNFANNVTTAAGIDTLVEIVAPLKESLSVEWKSGNNYLAGVIVSHEDKYYIVVSEHQAQAHQKPGSEGMLTIYRPFDIEQHEGTIDDPIPWVGGMDCYQGKYYSYEGNVYLLINTDLLPSLTHQYPGAPGVHHWQLVD